MERSIAYKVTIMDNVILCELTKLLLFLNDKLLK